MLCKCFDKCCKAFNQIIVASISLAARWSPAAGCMMLLADDRSPSACVNCFGIVFMFVKFRWNRLQFNLSAINRCSSCTWFTFPCEYVDLFRFAYVRAWLTGFSFNWMGFILLYSGFAWFCTSFTEKCVLCMFLNIIHALQGIALKRPQNIESSVFVHICDGLCGIDWN